MLPPVLIGLIGITHPAHLTFGASGYWRNLHVVLMPLFPLLALGPWLATRAIDRTYAWVALVLGFVYACFYTALDVLAGIGAGSLKHAHETGTGVLFGQASDLGHIGSVALIGANALAAGCVLRIAGARAAPGTALTIGGAYGFMENHVYWPGGVLSMFAIAAGWSLLLLALRPARAA
ncbi:MAG: hypothetical protein QOJ72_77 [Nocardioidaceae bacterium]|nr:hypothetical protein [Nocardioidaceae bacterium]